MNPAQFPKVLHKPTVLNGGLDLITPSLSLPAGFATYAVNFECSVSGGYTRVKGYERVDGRPAPSAALYTLVQIASYVNTPVVGATLTGNTSAATGVIAALGSNYLVLTKVVGTFTTTELVKVGATTIGTSVPITAMLTALQKAQYLNASADIYRADITDVGTAQGVGAVLGVFILNDVLYAFRALTLTPTTQGLFKATAGGWSLVTFPSEVGYNTSVGTGVGNSTPPAEGATLTQGVVTATVRRIMESTGAWRTAAGAGDGGRFIITNVAGGNFAAGAATLTGGATVMLTGAQTLVTLASTVPGTTLSAGSFVVGQMYKIVNIGTTNFTLIGATANTVGLSFVATGIGTGTGMAATAAKHECVQGNLFGQLGTLRIYGADGANRCYEFDGTYLCPITTGSTPDTPKHIAVHKNFLCISIASSLIISEVGQPYRYATGTETPVGDTISGLMPQPGSQTTGALAVLCRESTLIMYGTAPTGTSPFNMVPFNIGSGAIDYSLQNAGATFIFNNEGVTTLTTTLNYGNFFATSLTSRILPFVVRERSKVACSVRCTLKDQYRLFFNDGYGIYVTLVDGRPKGVMPTYFPNVPNCAWDSELLTGDAVIYFGATDGFVYQMEKGTSFDGANIDAIVILTWDPVNNDSRMLKKFRHASFELRSDTYAAFQFSYQLGYGSEEIDVSTGLTLESFTQGFTLWDVMNWDDFQWDGQSLLPSEADMTGSGENVQVSILSSSDYIDSFTLNSLIYHYSNLRYLR